MKNLLFVLLAAALLFSCQKKDQETTPQYQDVSFNASEILPEVGSRSLDDWICKDVDPTNAWVAIHYDPVTTDYYPELSVIEGLLYTQSIKLPVGANYCIENFILYKEVNGTPGYQLTDPETDIITHGTPLATSNFAGYVSNPLPYCFDVDAFEKEEIDIDVLCFEDVNYAEFGFNWFEITEIVLSGFCFFGDVCLNGEPFTPADFEGSLYGTGLAIDVPAIMKVLVYKDGVPVPNAEFNNEADQSEPLCAYYHDSEFPDEVFTFELYLWLPDETGFSYQLYYTYTSMDDSELMLEDGFTPADANENGLLDFVVGTCNYNDIDQAYDWLWIPGTDPDPVPPMPGDLVITEIMQNPSVVSDENGEWFEVYNKTEHPIIMYALSIEDLDGEFHLILDPDLIVPPYGFVVLGRNGDFGTNGGVNVNYEYGNDIELANSSDEVILISPDLELINIVEYDDGATFPDPNGASMSLDMPYTADNNDGTNWHIANCLIDPDNYDEGHYGTPGWDNFDCSDPE